MVNQILHIILNFNSYKKIAENFKELDVNFTSQKKFLSNLGIKQRAEIIGKNKTFTEKVDIFYRLKRLIDQKRNGRFIQSYVN